MGKRITGDILATLSEDIADVQPHRYRRWTFGPASGKVREYTGDPTWDEMNAAVGKMEAFWEEFNPPSSESLVGQGSQPILNWGKASDKGPLGRHRLMTAADAQAALKKNAFGYLSNLLKRLRQDGSYKAWFMWRASLRIVGRQFGRATLELADSFYTQHKRRQGKQIVSTRKTKWKRDGDYTAQFCGMHAYKLHHGRPSLSEAEWLRRYRARLKRRRQTKRRRKSTGVKVPQTRHKRPTGELNPRSRSGTVHEDTGGGPDSGPFGPAQTLTKTQRQEFLALARKDVDSLAKDFGEEVKTHARMWID